MLREDETWKKGMTVGLVSGVIWGFAALAVNYVTGIGPFERSLLIEITSFSIGGAIFGMLLGILLTLSYDWLPFKSLMPKAILVSTLVWLMFNVATGIGSIVNPERYHPELLQTIQGFFMAVLLGSILGALWNFGSKKDV